ncbi:hypothetical protein R75461_01643 [Paraburkholderia nemoris]|nr:hypothetical protein ADM96_07295 [Burkholderia sp. ST111]CAE6723650.1 hypothetical protein R75461_01643 [Paraburkholderia nemoris]CAE6731553.1 hypothetical protein R75777_02090 [Paraburkholderia nemoris]CAE6754480.1 hypothetical protein R69619_03085 [Paraburkholderia nemoris]CAE6940395.1 hypothetical protein R69608_05209 [Paraburkholderia nemoris]
MKRTRAMSPPVEVQYRTIEDGDNRASLARPDITAIAMTLATGMAARTADATPDSLLLERKGCAQAGSAARQRQT